MLCKNNNNNHLFNNAKWFSKSLTTTHRHMARGFDPPVFVCVYIFVCICGITIEWIAWFMMNAYAIAKSADKSENTVEGGLPPITVKTYFITSILYFCALRLRGVLSIHKHPLLTWAISDDQAGRHHFVSWLCVWWIIICKRPSHSAQYAFMYVYVCLKWKCICF